MRNNIFRILRISLLPAALAFTAMQLSAQRVTHLMTDFLEHTDIVWSGGYQTGADIASVGTLTGSFQYVEIRSRRPAFGWVLEGFRDSTLQSAYRLQIASSAKALLEDRPDIWDSGMISSRESSAVRPDIDLNPSSLYYWRVKVWSNRNEETPYSPVRAFRTASELDGAQARYPLVKLDQDPVSMRAAGNGCSLADFGRDAYSQLRVTATSYSGEDTLTVHLGEKLSDGRVDRDPGASIRYQCLSVPLRRGTHTYRIAFPRDQRNAVINPQSDHNPVLMPDYIGEVYPFRYAEFEGPVTMDLRPVRECVTYPFDDASSSFLSTDDVLNQVWDLCRYTIMATSALGVYIDGDRERIPYEADAIINQLGHYSVDRDWAMARYSTEYLLHNATWPTEWILQGVLMSWYDWMYTGDTMLLERNYEILKARTLSDLRDANGLISTRTGRQTTELMRRIGYAGESVRDIVDWPQSGAFGIGKDEAGEADAFEFSDYNTVVNAYHYRSLVLMAEIAEALGRGDDAAEYRCDAEAFLDRFNDLLLDRRKGAYRDGVGVRHYSLHSSMFPLCFGMVPRKSLDDVTEHVLSRGMACSVYGAQFLLEALYGANEDDAALSLLTDTGLRGWYNMLRAGSTMTMEAWDETFKPNLDWNHAWGAAPANIIPRCLLGVTPLEPGWSRIRIMPQTGNLEKAEAVIPTIKGEIEYSVSRDGNLLTLDVTVPANTTAEIWLPDVQGGWMVENVGSGQHRYETIVN